MLIKNWDFSCAKYDSYDYCLIPELGIDFIPFAPPR